MQDFHTQKCTTEASCSWFRSSPKVHQDRHYTEIGTELTKSTLKNVRMHALVFLKHTNTSNIHYLLKQYNWSLTPNHSISINTIVQCGNFCLFLLFWKHTDSIESISFVSWKQMCQNTQTIMYKTGCLPLPQYSTICPLEGLSNPQWFYRSSNKRKQHKENMAQPFSLVSNNLTKSSIVGMDFFGSITL